jgi:hypothetical protein
VPPISWFSCIKDIGHHLFFNLSAVQSLFLRASQARDLVFEGAHTFQIIVFMLLEIAHTESALYAEVVEY